eukprot:765977-Hanusia_phi.AAC.2
MSDECPICMEPLSDRRAVGFLACCSNCRFCADCIVRWGKESENRCPLCRSDFSEILCMQGESCWNVKVSRRQQPVQQYEEDDGEDEDDECCVCMRRISNCREGLLVGCDGCQYDFCLDCLGLEDSSGLPEGDWFCDSCRGERGGGGGGGGGERRRSSRSRAGVEPEGLTAEVLGQRRDLDRRERRHGRNTVSPDDGGVGRRNRVHWLGGGGRRRRSEEEEERQEESWRRRQSSSLSVGARSQVGHRAGGNGLSEQDEEEKEGYVFRVGGGGRGGRQGKGRGGEAGRTAQ